MLISALHAVSPEHINVCFEDGSEIRSTLGVTTEMKLYSGKDLDDDALNTLRMKSAAAFAVEKGINLLSYRQMSGKELHTKLIQKGVDPEAAEAAVEKLYDLRILDDELYASSIVRHYTAKGYGAGRVRAELSRRGVSRDYWEDALASAPETDDKLDQFIRARLRDPEDRDQVRKVSAALFRRGYSWDEIRAGIRRFSSDAEDNL